MKMRSRVRAWKRSSSSPRRISCSRFVSSIRRSTFFFRMSVTLMRRGRPWSRTIGRDESDFSQFVNAYSATIAFSWLSPAWSSSSILTVSLVRSCSLRTGTFFFLIASSMDSAMESVVSPHGSSVMTSLFLSSFSILARTLTLPSPSWYSLTSMIPPSWKSG